MSQWQWINPIPPTDQYMNVVHLSSQTYIAVGYFSIMKTTDSGNTWDHHTFDDIPGFQTIFFLDENIGLAGGENGNLVKTENGGIDWEIIESGISEPINDVFFINADVGFIAADKGEIHKTSDGGITWTDCNVAGMNLPFYCISFINENVGYAGGFYGAFYKTTNGGESWSGSEASIGHINAIHLRDQNTIIAATELGIYKSTNGGDSWSQVLSTGNYDVFAMRFNTINIGHAVGYKSEIYKTTDGGDSWSVISAPNDNYLNPWDKGIAFENENKGIIIDWNLHRIDLSLNSWNEIENSGVTSKYLNGVTFSNDTTIYAAGNNAIIKSSYNGREWNIVYENDLHFFNAIAFANENSGFAVGRTADETVVNKGLILNTIDAGKNWTTAHTTQSQLRAICFPSSTIGFAVGQEGKIHKTSDGGSTWVEKSSGVSNHFYSISFVDSQTGLVCGSGGIVMKTADGGETWTSISSGTTNWLYSISISDNGVAHAVGSSKRLIRSTDFGNTWSSVTLSDGMAKTLFAVCFATPNIGYIAGEDGLSYFTTDGGVSWNYKRLPYFDHIYGLASGNEHTMIAVGSWGAILRSYTGPDEFPIENGDDDDTNTYISPINYEDSLHLIAYPNPFSKFFYIQGQFTENQDVKVELFSIVGKLVYSRNHQITNNRTLVNPNNIIPGIYYLRITRGTQIQALKIINVQ